MPFLWSAGGDLLNADNTKAIFNGPEGVKALTLLQQMSTEDNSVYLDGGDGSKSLGLFTSGHIAMYNDGPWDLATVRDSGMDYGITTIPKDQVTATISGPDNWVVFDNGDAEEERGDRLPEVVHRARAGHPVGDRDRAAADPPVGERAPRVPDVPRPESGDRELGRERGERDQEPPAGGVLPEVSEAVATAVSAALLGKMSPQEALDAAAQQVDAELAGA